MIAEWEKQSGPSSTPVIFDAHDRDILERMCWGSSYGIHEDTVYVDNWAVNEEFLFHKHPEFGEVFDVLMPGISTAELEFTTRDGKCDLCHTQVPGELEFLHKMYQL